jgi:methylenetetrahydrofolate reductase (NADPH)
VRTARSLRYIDEHVPGISVPPALIERVESSADPEAECFEIGCELADAARRIPGVRGLHLISFRKEAGIARLCNRLKIPTRAERELSGDRSRIVV